MTNIILLVIIIFLLIFFLKNFREGYIDYSEINKDLWKNSYSKIRDDVYDSMERNTDCRTLDNINTQKTLGKYMRMPCKSVDGLKEDKKCKKKVCESTPGCFVEGEKCLSVCSSIEGKDAIELRTKCENQPNCIYDKNNPRLKDRCFYHKSVMIPQTSVEKYQSKCNLVNTICKDDADPKCVENLCNLNRYCMVKDKKCILNTGLVSDSIMNNPQGIVDKDSFAKDSGRYAKYPNAIDIKRETVLEVKNPFKRSILDKIYNDYYKINNYSFNTFFDDVKDFSITTKYCKKEKTLDWGKVKNIYMYLEEKYPKIKNIEVWRCDIINYTDEIEKEILKLFDVWFKKNSEDKEEDSDNKDLDEVNKNYNEMNNYNNSYNPNDFNKFYRSRSDELSDLQKKRMTNILSRDLKSLDENLKSLDEHLKPLDEDLSVEMKDVDDLDKNFYTMANNKNQNIVINKENNKVEGMPIVQQHIQGVGNIYAPEIIIR
jgi:hypothetical protein